MNEKHEANRSKWEANARWWQSLRDRDGLWCRCPVEPELAFEGDALALVRGCVPDSRQTRVCVVGSGDNYAAFALAGLGMSITSVDIAQALIDVAKERAPNSGSSSSLPAPTQPTSMWERSIVRSWDNPSQSTRVPLNRARPGKAGATGVRPVTPFPESLSVLRGLCGWPVASRTASRVRP